MEKAISLASKKKLPIHFLYVVNLETLSQVGVRTFPYILREMLKLGESIVLTAQRKAKSMGILAKGEVRQGKAEDEILQTSKEVDADLVVIGAPRGQDSEDIFTDESLARFAQRIESEANSKVILT